VLQQGLARLDRLPQLVLYNAELRDLGDDLCLRRRGPRQTSAGRGILEPGLPSPDLTTEIELVVEDASALGAVAVDGAWRPGAAAGGGDTLSIEGVAMRLGKRPDP
jgi:hypothetical protein